MKSFFGGLFSVIAMLGYITGCTTSSRVVVEPRKIPDYSYLTQSVPTDVKITVYPASEKGDAEMRKMLKVGYKMLTDVMKRSGYKIISPEIENLKHDQVCIVELAECRHDMPEWTSGGIAALVTVVAVRVRKPGIMRNNRIECGKVRSFQGVYRMDLGARPLDFHLTENEYANGINGALTNLMKAAPFREAILECGKDT